MNIGFAFGGATATAGTAFTFLVPPSPGANRPALAQRVVNGRPNWLTSGYTIIDQISYQDAGTAHDLVAMRPLNWTTVNGAVAANATVVNITADPGAWGTAGIYKYALPPGAAGIPSQVASNVIATNDYVAVQLLDGTWHVSIVTVSALALTLTTAVPNVTGGGIADGAILYFFGISTDTNPQTGKAHDKFKTGASSARQELLSTKGNVTYMGYFPGDPILLYSANATNAGTLALVAGRWADA